VRQPAERSLKAAEKNENGDNEKYHADAAGGGIAPIAAKGPAGECSEKGQDQDDDQDSSKHDLLLDERLQAATIEFPAPARLLVMGRFSRRDEEEVRQRDGSKFLDHDSDGETSAGIVGVVHVIATIHVINVEGVGVIPVGRPGINESKPITAVLEAGVSANDNWITHVEVVATAKAGTEMIVGDAAATASTEVESGLRVLCGGGLLGALGSTV